jgi:hypothetical protein
MVNRILIMEQRATVDRVISLPLAGARPRSSGVLSLQPARQRFIIISHAASTVNHALPRAPPDCNAGVGSEIDAQARAERYRENGFQNNLTTIFVKAFVQTYANGNSEIDTNTVKIPFCTESAKLLLL